MNVRRNSVYAIENGVLVTRVPDPVPDPVVEVVVIETVEPPPPRPRKA